MAGYGTSPATQSGGGALRSEDLDSDVKAVKEQRKKRKNALKRAIFFDEMLDTMEFVLKSRPDFDEDAAAVLVNHLYKNGGML